MHERIVHCKKERYDVYIGRPSIWGNPFKIGIHGNRQEVIEKYEEHIRSSPLLMAGLEHLQSRTLGCWCPPKHCHGEVIIKLIREIEESETKSG